MLRRFDPDTAKQELLNRRLAVDVPAALVKSLERRFGEGATPESAVASILRSVRENGDQALRQWGRELDGVDLTDWRVPEEAIREAEEALPADLREAFELAIHRIRRFHALQPIPGWTTHTLGGTLGQRCTPVQSAGVYIPGGTAPLPSSVLMSAIPALVAGVPRIVLCTPPEPDAIILAAASMLQLTEIYTLGGAQAIAAMAYGTESIKPVDKIVGAGNLFVTLAKRQVFGVVGLDGLAGPTETMVIADASARPAWVAADLLAQAEHDPLATAILISDDPALLDAVDAAIATQLEERSRKSVIAQSLAGRSGSVLVPDLETAAGLANDYAPEHLCLAVEDAAELSTLIHSAGGIFIGERSFEVLGDYVAGPSHVMPTGGSARYSSPLNVLDFVKLTSIIALDNATSKRLNDAAVVMASAEGLDAHAASARIRQEEVHDER